MSQQPSLIRNTASISLSVHFSLALKGTVVRPQILERLYSLGRLLQCGKMH